MVLLLLLILTFGNRKHFDLRQNLPFISTSRFEFSLLVYLFLIIVVVGLVAWAAPPNTWDSMTYHMGRVIHWMQNRSVAHYPTHILRQLHQNPWSEFAILHFQILSNGDYFANFIQWFSMVGSIVGVSLLAKELNATTRGQIFSAIVCATIPMGILQGSSTQTDYVVSFWLVCFVYFFILFRKNINFLYALGAGLALGLAILTKATAYIFAFPFLVWFSLSSIKSRHPKKMLFIAFALAITFVVNLGHYVRNSDLYGSPLGPGQEGANFGYANEVYTLPSIISNLLRNIGLHLTTPFSQVNDELDNVIYVIFGSHKVIGISPNDVRTTWPGAEFHIPQLSLDENIASNPIHLFLVMVAFLLYFFQRTEEKDVGIYAFSLLLAFLLFCAYLKWQPWHSRLHLPLFVLYAPFIGLMFSRIRNYKIANLSIASLIVLALPWMFLNSSRPILGVYSIFTTGRIEQYFRSRPSLAVSYVESAQILSDLHCSKIGLVINGDDWEYPLWVLLREKMGETVRLEHLNVINISQKKYEKKYLVKSTVCAIFVVQDEPPENLSIADIIYLRYWSSGSVSVYKRTLRP